ncbi:MAG: hypothetical protein WCC74_00335 [Minisyncoccia bacterium]
MRKDSSLKDREVEVSTFWSIIEDWENTTPNSLEDKACVEKIKNMPMFKKELLLAYQMIQEDTPLKDVLLMRIINCAEVNVDDWIDAADLTIDVGSIQRRK